MNEEITIEFIFQFMLVFARIGTAFSYFPSLGSAYIFTRGKLAVALVVSFVMTPMLLPYLPKYTENFASNTLYLAIEIMIGFIISLAANIYFQSLHYVGQIISMQSGLGSAAFFDPMQKSQVTLISNFLVMVVTVLIFATDTHYLFIKGVAESYEKFPVGELINSGDLSKFVTFIINDSFILAFKISSPFLLVGLAILVGGGMLARLMPNLQIFFIITPAQIIITFGTLYIVIEAAITKVINVIGNSVNFTGL